MSKLKTRVPNFSASEKTHLMRIIANKFAHILEDKKTDRAASTKKIEAWRDIEVEFNASSTCSTHRDAVSLKKCYENRKKELRKLLAEERKETMLTGGGPPIKIKKDEADDLLLSIVNEKTLVGLTNPFDDDAEGICIQSNKESSSDIFEFEYMSEVDEEPVPNALQNTSISMSVLQTSSSHKLLQEAKEAEPINNSEIIAKSTKTNLEQTNNKWKTYTPKQLQAPVSAPLTFPVTEAEKISSERDQKTPRKNSSRRRPTTIVKPLTSSDVAKKYDMLLDKRLQLLDAQLAHMAKENELILRKRKLEIDILEIELKNKDRQL